ncbi:hypothetical protein A9K66_00450 [Mesorhizobium sp. AA23]|nr:hypothetical protein A9K66_00450 [Mesorhizobium sp. AA23]
MRDAGLELDSSFVDQSAGICINFTRSIGRQYGDVASVGPHEQCLLHRLFRRAQDCDPLIDHLIAVTDRTEAQGAGSDHIVCRRRLWKLIHNPSSQERRAGTNGCRTDRNKICSVAANLVDYIVPKIGSALQSLLPQPIQQFGAGYAVGEAGTVAGNRNELRAALTAIDNDDPAAKAPEIRRCC